MLMINPGQRLIDTRSDTVYIIQNIKQGHILLVSEDGEGGMLLDQDSVVLSGFRTVYDQRATDFDLMVPILERSDQTELQKSPVAHFLKKARVFWRTTVRSLADV